MATEQHAGDDAPGAVGEVAQLFLKLGTIAFGGPAAHIAMMDDEIVRKRGWLSRERFLDLLGATNLIPGPNSTEMAIHLGFLRAGWRGLIVAGACFILPAMTITGVLAWAYVRFGSLPEVFWLLYGVKPVIIAIVVQALWGFALKAVKGPFTGAAGAAVVALSFLGWDEVLLLLVAGVATMLATRAGQKGTPATAVGRPCPSSWNHSGWLQTSLLSWATKIGRSPTRRTPRSWA